MQLRSKRRKALERPEDATFEKAAVLVVGRRRSVLEEVHLDPKCDPDKRHAAVARKQSVEPGVDW
jgi:hypothetical protein